MDSPSTFYRKICTVLDFRIFPELAILDWFLIWWIKHAIIPVHTYFNLSLYHHCHIIKYWSKGKLWHIHNICDLWMPGNKPQTGPSIPPKLQTCIHFYFTNISNQVDNLFLGSFLSWATRSRRQTFRDRKMNLWSARESSVARIPNSVYYFGL